MLLPAKKYINIDPWWKNRAGSFGPDKGCYCTYGTEYVHALT